MNYNLLGNTGIKVSRLGFGAMRLPMHGQHVDFDEVTRMIHRAFEGGVNYIDTAVFYCGEESQVAVGKALQGWRDKVTVSTKNHYYGEDYSAWRKNLDDSLDRLQVDTIDIYNTHGINSKALNNDVKPRIHKWLEKARDEGLIRFICTSFHDTPEALVEVIDSGIYSVITVQYNMLNRDLEEAIAYAAQQGVGVVVMGPVGGGRLGGMSPQLSETLPEIGRVPELALRFVAANPNVNVVLSGMSTMEQVEENLRIMSDDHQLAEAEVEAINRHVERLRDMSDLKCTACGYCKPCPAGVNIPRVFDMYNQARTYGLWDFYRQQYADWMQQRPEDNLPADACTQCNACIEKCPQKIDIPTRLEEAHQALCMEPFC